MTQERRVVVADSRPAAAARAPPMHILVRRTGSTAGVVRRASIAPYDRLDVEEPPPPALCRQCEYPLVHPRGEEVAELLGGPGEEAPAPYCPRCGEEQVAVETVNTCGGCGLPVHERDNFCPGCGKPVVCVRVVRKPAPPRPASPARRRNGRRKVALHAALRLYYTAAARAGLESTLLRVEKELRLPVEDLPKQKGKTGAGRRAAAAAAIYESVALGEARGIIPRAKDAYAARILRQVQDQHRKRLVAAGLMAREVQEEFPPPSPTPSHSSDDSHHLPDAMTPAYRAELDNVFSSFSFENLNPIGPSFAAASPLPRAVCTTNPKSPVSGGSPLAAYVPPLGTISYWPKLLKDEVESEARVQEAWDDQACFKIANYETSDDGEGPDSPLLLPSNKRSPRDGGSPMQAMHPLHNTHSANRRGQLKGRQADAKQSPSRSAAPSSLTSRGAAGASGGRMDFMRLMKSATKSKGITLTALEQGDPDGLAGSAGTRATGSEMSDSDDGSLYSIVIEGEGGEGAPQQQKAAVKKKPAAAGGLSIAVANGVPAKERRPQHGSPDLDPPRNPTVTSPTELVNAQPSMFLRKDRARRGAGSPRAAAAQHGRLAAPLTALRKMSTAERVEAELAARAERERTQKNHQRRLQHLESAEPPVPSGGASARRVRGAAVSGKPAPRPDPPPAEPPAREVLPSKACSVASGKTHSSEERPRKKQNGAMKAPSACVSSWKGKGKEAGEPAGSFGTSVDSSARRAERTVYASPQRANPKLSVKSGYAATMSSAFQNRSPTQPAAAGFPPGKKKKAGRRRPVRRVQQRGKQASKPQVRSPQLQKFQGKVAGGVWDELDLSSEASSETSYDAKACPIPISIKVKKAGSGDGEAAPSMARTPAFRKEAVARPLADDPTSTSPKTKPARRAPPPPWASEKAAVKQRLSGLRHMLGGPHVEPHTALPTRPKPARRSPSPVPSSAAYEASVVTSTDYDVATTPTPRQSGQHHAPPFLASSPSSDGSEPRMPFVAPPTSAAERRVAKGQATSLVLTSPPSASMRRAKKNILVGGGTPPSRRSPQANKASPLARAQRSPQVASPQRGAPKREMSLLKSSPLHVLTATELRSAASLSPLGRAQDAPPAAEPAQETKDTLESRLADTARAASAAAERRTSGADSNSGSGSADEVEVVLNHEIARDVIDEGQGADAARTDASEAGRGNQMELAGIARGVCEEIAGADASEVGDSEGGSTSGAEDGGTLPTASDGDSAAGGEPIGTDAGVDTLVEVLESRGAGVDTLVEADRQPERDGAMRQEEEGDKQRQREEGALPDGGESVRMAMVRPLSAVAVDSVSSAGSSPPTPTAASGTPARSPTPTGGVLRRTPSASAAAKKAVSFTFGKAGGAGDVVRPMPFTDSPAAPPAKAPLPPRSLSPPFRPASGRRLLQTASMRQAQDKQEAVMPGPPDAAPSKNPRSKRSKAPPLLQLAMPEENAPAVIPVGDRASFHVRRNMVVLAPRGKVPEEAVPAAAPSAEVRRVSAAAQPAAPDTFLGGVAMLRAFMASALAPASGPALLGPQQDYPMSPLQAAASLSRSMSRRTGGSNSTGSSRLTSPAAPPLPQPQKPSFSRTPPQ